MINNFNTVTFEDLEKYVDEHDCHDCPDDGCVCYEAKEELAKRKAEREKVLRAPDIEKAETEWELQSAFKNYIKAHSLEEVKAQLTLLLQKATLELIKEEDEV